MPATRRFAVSSLTAITLAVAGLASAHTSACTVQLGDEELGTALSGELVSECVYPESRNITGQGSGFSLSYPEGAYWIFDETIIGTEGTGLGFLSSSAATANAAPTACEGELDYLLDEDGRVREILELTPEERAVHTDPDQPAVKLWPKAGFVHDGVGYVYYDKVLFRGYFDYEVVGTGVARIRYGEPAERLLPGKYAGEPSLLWRGPGWGTGAVVANDGTPYVYGCQQTGLDASCRVARADPARIGEASGYEYRSGDGWSADASSATPVLDGTSYLSVSYNDFTSSYVAVYAGVLDNDVRGRTASTPYGPFSRASTKLFRGDEPADFAIGGVRQHPAHAGARGRDLVISYSSDDADGTTGMRVVRFRLPEQP